MKPLPPDDCLEQMREERLLPWRKYVRAVESFSVLDLSRLTPEAVDVLYPVAASLVQINRLHRGALSPEEFERTQESLEDLVEDLRDSIALRGDLKAFEGALKRE